MRADYPRQRVAFEDRVWTPAHEAALRRASAAASNEAPAAPRPAEAPPKVLAPRAMHAELVLQVVARLSGTTVEALVSSRRWRSVALPRHVAMWLLRARTMMSFPEIGSVVGGRDHTTVISAVRKIARLCDESDEVAGFVARCCAELEEPTRLRIQVTS
jgi:chromosomal replication initiator protein